MQSGMKRYGELSIGGKPISSLHQSNNFMRLRHYMVHRLILHVQSTCLLRDLPVKL